MTQFIHRMRGGDIGESLWMKEPRLTKITRLIVQDSWN
tara:strand:- start:160 stop:273 length:114 start_codon:yes stop_codon:yes gene_type:complete